MIKDFHLRFFSSILIFFPLLLLFSKNNLVFLFITQVILFLSLWEFFRLKSFKDYYKEHKKINILLSRHKISSLDFFIILNVNLLFLLYFNYSNSIFILIILFFFIPYIFYVLKFDFEKFLGLVYCSVPFFIFINLRNDNNYDQYLFFIFFFVILTDVFSYFSGKILKGKKIYPLISSGKTISGTIGGILIPCILCVFMFVNLKDVYLIVFSSIFFSIIVQLGDLLESYFKRLCNVKDSGNLIPGHGGVLDRLDGLFSLTIVIFILKILKFNFFFII